MGSRGLTRAVNGKMISSNENALRSHCKRCDRTIYIWQATVWQRSPKPGLVHADEGDCGE